MRRIRSKSLWRLVPLNEQGNTLFETFSEVGEWYWENGKLKAVIDPKTAQWVWKKKREVRCSVIRLQHPADNDLYIDVKLEAPWFGTYRFPRTAVLRRDYVLRFDHLEADAAFAPLILEA